VSGDDLVVPVFYDFASTLSYVAHRVLGRLTPSLEQAALRLDWRPIDLTRIAGWERGASITGPRRDHVAAVARSLAGGAHVPRVWLDVRRAATVALRLRGTSSEATWRERVWTGIYEEGRDPGDDATVEAWARDVCVDPRPYADHVCEPDSDLLAKETTRARTLGVTAVPTLLLGEWPMAGVQDDETMRSVLLRFASRAR